MTADDDARRRLADAMNKRRVELRLTWTEVAQRAKMSIGHLSRIRNNEATLSDLATASLQAALDWPPGEIDKILTDAKAYVPPDESRPVTSLPDADKIGVSAILAIINAQQRELAELRSTVEELRRERDAERGERGGRKHG